MAARFESLSALVAASDLVVEGDVTAVRVALRLAFAGGQPGG